MYRYDQAGRGVQRSVIEQPAESLRGLIAHFWLHEIEIHQRGWRVVPDGSAHLLYHAPLEPGAPGALVIVGARTVHVDVDLSARRFTVGARLRPGALAVLTKCHARDLTDRAVTLKELDPDWADQLHDALASAPAPAVALRIMHERVAQRLAGMQADDWVLRVTRGLESPSARVAEVSASQGESTRWLRERFQRAVGLTPKRYARVSRLFRALDQLISAADPDWPAIAASSGCFDQSHLIHEFQELLGESPARFLSRGTPHAVFSNTQHPRSNTLRPHPEENDG